MSSKEVESKPIMKESENGKTTNSSDSQGEQKAINPDDLIDMTTFDQLLDMDEEDDHEFSFSIVTDYFDQAETTFKDMDKALDEKNLPRLSQLGHFLKGSSAAIGLKKVKETCEEIQNIGNRQDKEGGQLDESEALRKITPLLPQVKEQYSEAEEYLKSFYEVQDAR
ncbi:hypothetical protein DFQ28_005311 [Apophysomyces sp. BC1034]|nr:hypothetical protein DFQ30_006141 [Apophysomyces sp. BC1015]KAG0178018.1 hypothetical protein DFQ29_004038 [Apophysomyces sp. BC1021]KAG0188165.1 hypothetical protein DFQ28_005311 [Apophysomyces sp. BC1034]